MIGIRRDHEAVKSTVPEGKLRWLGEANGYQYGALGDREYAVAFNPSPDPGDYVRQRGEILVSRVRRELIDGSAYEHHLHFRGFPVRSGSYEALAKARKPAVEKPKRAWAVLASLPAMQRREPRRLASVPESPRVTVGAWKALVPGLKPEVIEIGGHQPPEAGPAGTIADLASRGVQLTAPRGRLLAVSRTPLRFDDKELIEKSEELLVGHLMGQPVPCVMCDRPAVDYGFPDAPLCAAHLEPRP